MGAHKDNIERNKPVGYKRAVFHGRRRARQEAAHERELARAERTDQEQLDKIRAEGHHNGPEIERLRKRIAES
jgi:hypothetical protein